MMALASSLMAILSLLIELGLLIWLIVAGRSSARALAIIGITLLLARGRWASRCRWQPVRWVCGRSRPAP